jgi:hypothetical protein
MKERERQGESENSPSSAPPCVHVLVDFIINAVCLFVVLFIDCACE